MLYPPIQLGTKILLLGFCRYWLIPPAIIILLSEMSHYIPILPAIIIQESGSLSLNSNTTGTNNTAIGFNLYGTTPSAYKIQLWDLNLFLPITAILIPELDFRLYIQTASVFKTHRLGLFFEFQHHRQ